MLVRSIQPARLGLMLASVAALLVLSTATVAADTGPAPGGDATFSQNGRTADAWGGDCRSNGDGTSTCEGHGVSAFVGKMSDSFTGVVHANQACAFIETYTIDDATGEPVAEPTFESGCDVDLPSGAINASKKLASVALAPTTLTVYAYVCGETSCDIVSERDVTIEGTWTGFGPTVSSKGRSSYDDGTCRYDEHNRQSVREATFAGSIDGSPVAGDGYATIADGKSTFRSRCVEI